MNEHVDDRTAIKAAKLGYKNGSLHYYRVLKNGFAKLVNNSGAYYINGLGEKLYEAPTVADLIVWLLDTHNILIYYSQTFKDDARIFVAYIMKDGKKQSNFNLDLSIALEKAVDDALTMLENE